VIPIQEQTETVVPEERIEIAVRRDVPDRIYRGVATAAGFTTLALMALIGGFLLFRGASALRKAGFSFLTTEMWAPDQGGDFGIGAVLPYTIQISLVALFIAVPISIATALFITQYAPAKIRRPLTSLVDLLAALPSLSYGRWGLFYLQPRLITVGKWMGDNLGWIPLFKASGPAPHSIGQFAASTFVAGVVVSFMVIPLCTSVMREVFAQAPMGEQEAALALGGTKWGVIRDVVLPFGRGGIIGGAMLGLGRALGETIAVTLIISPMFVRQFSIMEQGSNSIAALIALKFSESNANGISALMAAGLALFLLTLLVNAIASVIVGKGRSGAQTEI
jgi:phosphate transport system permease protein